MSATKKGAGGSRPGAGRPKGTGRYKEPTTPIRVPNSLLSPIKSYIDQCRRKGEPSASPPQGLKLVYDNATTPAPALPLFSSKVAAGFGFPAPDDDHIDMSLDISSHLIKNPPATFFVRAQGDSMIDAGIHPDDLLIVDRSITPTSGKIVIAVLNGELTVKRLHIKNGQTFLIPENKKYEPIEIKEHAEFMIWGVVTNALHEV